MGLGHLMRCRALAEALIATGHRCDFIVAGLESALSQPFEAAGITIHRIELEHDRDAASTLSLANSLHADGLIVDGYHFTDPWRLALRRAGKPILAFADGPLRPLHADLLIDAASPRSDRPTELFGPDYVLLRRELAAAAKRPPLPIAERCSILVTFGGSDPAALTVPTVTALHRLLPETPLTVVVGSATPRAATVASDLSMLGPWIDVRVAPPHMGDLMRTAGLAISAAGGTVGELAAIGVPPVLAIVADNQVAGAAACAAAGWCTPIDARQDEEAPVKLAAARRRALASAG